MPICKTCQINKEYTDFHTTGKNKTLKKECKQCSNLKRRQKRKENPEKYRLQDQEKYKKHKDEILKKAKDYYRINKDSILIKDKEYRKENKVSIKNRNSTYYTDNKEKIKNRSRIYYANNTEKIKNQKKEYYKTEKGRLAIKNGRSTYKARKISSSDGTVTNKNLKVLADFQNNKCFYCGKPIVISNSNTHLDHYIPLSKGGKHSIHNVVWSCDKCNLSKNATFPKELKMFEHTEVILPKKAKFKISPSGIADFFNSPVTWYKDHILKERQFTGSTATVLGTVIHYFAENFYTKPYDVIDLEVRTALSSIKDPEIDLHIVRQLYPDMVSTLISEYLSKNNPSDIELSMCQEVKGNIYVGGTCDARQNTIVVDYKNVSKKPSDTIPFNYLIQLLAYAYMYRGQGINVDTVRLVYTVRPTKTLPVRVFVVSKIITPDDWDMIENTLELISDTVIKHYEDPKLDYLLFKSMRLKLKAPAKLFKNGG